MTLPTRIYSRCRKCGGRIYAQRRLILGTHTGVWLHLAEADWHDSPHNALPTLAAVRRLAAQMRAEDAELAAKATKPIASGGGPLSADAGSTRALAPETG